jgi:hypothetical protein
MQMAECVKFVIDGVYVDKQAVVQIGEGKKM